MPISPPSQSAELRLVDNREAALILAFRRLTGRQQAGLLEVAQALAALGD